MKRLGQFGALLVSLALITPAIAHSADSIPEQWAQLAAPGAGGGEENNYYLHKRESFKESNCCQSKVSNGI